MNLADLRADFLHELNRKDCTEDLATGFIAKALRRIQRECRLPCMEASLIYSADGSTMAKITIPPDLLAPIDLFVPATISGSGGASPDGEVGLTQFPYRTLQQFPAAGPVMGYARLGGEFHFRGVIPDGSYVNLVYYAAGPDVVSDTDETAIMASAPDLVRFAALTYAGIVYEKPQTADWESAYQATKDSTDLLARDLDTMGGPAAVSPAYEA